MSSSAHGQRLSGPDEMVSTRQRPTLSLATAVDSPDSGRLASTRDAVTLGDADWRSRLRTAALAQVADFVSDRSASALGGSGWEVAGDILLRFVSEGKCLRSTFMYLGWLCGAGPNNAALSAAASLELLHAFALLQDDVMDQSPQRRGSPAVHVQLARCHQRRRLSGAAARFGESAAVLLGDICLVWAEQMLRESGVEDRRLRQVWPRYDAMRIELAVGQLCDMSNDIRNLPTLDAVLDVARRKSGNYTVRRPLEMGAAMADCDERTLEQLARYGDAVGEAFQLRDDMLGVFGTPAITGKPSGDDLRERKATSVVVAAYEMADPPTRRQLRELMNRAELDDAAVDHCKRLITATGAAQRIEDMIDRRVDRVRTLLADMTIGQQTRAALGDLAAACVQRST
ncbi:polyprenyl synthetase family protein [Mycobacterium marinum]|uniref:polyprenyl synthetase family protein n=1 Tax=Mycobacterium marinum TaxID=1781 RepID=UPI000E3BBFC5|nr:polyprenyl synthetase family protein [Mycobacterium marinum]